MGVLECYNPRMPLSAVVTSLPTATQDALRTIVKPKFDAYFAFTSARSGGQPRSIPDPNGQPWFIYPVQTMIPDLAFLWSLFSDVYQILGGPKPLASFINSDTIIVSDITRILEGHSSSDQDGEFWHFPRGQVRLADVEGIELEEYLRTLRNSYAHSHWLHTNLSAFDYWTTLGWDTKNAPAAFRLSARPQKNFMMYIADATPPWESQQFWSMTNLRIIVTPSHVLRYHLHLFLNYILNGERSDVFQH